ncbi:IS5 family transposase (plasmid) [Deinococcus radiomollis]|uniref:IS5 family transposase n=1 Tax=Deinococcus radiomollis TaxID=468916 RepID=UPI0038928ECC
MTSSKYERTLRLNQAQFRRKTGVDLETFVEMEAVLHKREAGKRKSGRPPALPVGAQLLLTLEFWREYRTSFHLGQDWDIHETTVGRTVGRVEEALLKSGRFSLPGKKTLRDADTVFTAVVVDVSEVPCERPNKKQRAWYSGKKKRHTMKLQLLIHPVTSKILCVATGRGATHDLRLLRESKTPIHPETELIADAGYQGIQHQHAFTRTPKKASKHHPLTDEQRASNRQLARVRLPVEHVIRRLKVFRIMKETYRHRRRRFHLRVNLIAALCNRLPIRT